MSFKHQLLLWFAMGSILFLPGPSQAYIPDKPLAESPVLQPYKVERIVAPVAGSISSGFGWRSDPMGKKGRFHSGIDIAAPQGTPIYATQSGMVVFSGVHGGYGNVVVLQHGEHLFTLYGHASRVWVSPGQWVQVGQAIASVGSTGRSTGPHLHFEVHHAGRLVHPLAYLRDAAPVVASRTKQIPRTGKAVARLNRQTSRPTVQLIRGTDVEEVRF